MALCYLDISTIPSGGIGLFALRDIEIGENITIYYGYVKNKKMLTRNEAIYSISYTFKGKDCVCVGITDSKSLRKNNVGLAQMANDALTPEITGKSNNSYFVQSGLIIYLRAYRTISKAEEIFVSYGLDYWNDKIGILTKDSINLLSHLSEMRDCLEEKLCCTIIDYYSFDRNIITLYIGKNTLWKCAASSKVHKTDMLVISLDEYKNVYLHCRICFKDVLLMRWNNYCGTFL